jgi:hypothetical protein
MFRPNLAFLECKNLREGFESELFLLCIQIPEHFDPHMCLEYCKAMIQTKTSEYSLKFKKINEDKHRNLCEQMNRVQNILCELQRDVNHPLHRFLNVSNTRSSDKNAG